MSCPPIPIPRKSLPDTVAPSCSLVSKAVVHDEGYGNHHVLFRYTLEWKEHKKRWEDALGWLVLRHLTPEQIQRLATQEVPASAFGKSGVLFYWGNESNVAGPWVLNELHKRFGLYGVLRVTDMLMGHWLFMTAPDKIGRGVEQFLVKG